MYIPQRASSLLLEELHNECANSGSCSFLQFSAASRSLSMLPDFLSEAEKLCKKLNSGGAQQSEKQSPTKQSPSKQTSGNVVASVTAESLLAVLSIGGGGGKSNAKSQRRNNNGGRGMRESVLNIIGESSKGEKKSLGVYDLVGAALKY